MEQQKTVLVYERHDQDARYRLLGDVCETVSAKYGTGGGNMPMVLTLTREAGRTDIIIRRSDDMSYQEQTGSLLASGYSKLGTQEAANDMYVTEPCNWDGAATSPTLTTRNAGGGQRMPDKDNFNAVIDKDPAFSATTGSYMVSSEEQTSTLMARDYKDPQITASARSVVRRLTPTECGRLQGFPDGWCDIGDWVDSKGKLHKDSDTPKYKAFGNSIAVGYANEQSGFWCWLARRIAAQYERRITMASLFDGIGGFPLAFSCANATPVWASEIEEFPIAVTKRRFPESEDEEVV